MTGQAELSHVVDQTARRIANRHSGAVAGAIVAAGRVRLPADGPAPDVGTLFEIGSISKVFTALLLAEAVIRGELTLDTPLKSILPRAVEVPTRNGVEMTLEHLANAHIGPALSAKIT
ncbi:MAG: beta-lactamase family protein [Pseudonocardia sp.]|nr:beta-lactamase family protein [Pseudonocardia sp.]